MREDFIYVTFSVTGHNLSYPYVEKHAHVFQPWFVSYRKISNMRLTLAGKNIVDHSDVVGACRRGSNYIFILDLIPGLNGLDKDIFKARQETFKVRDFVHLILEIWRYFFSLLFQYRGVNLLYTTSETKPLSPLCCPMGPFTGMD